MRSCRDCHCHGCQNAALCRMGDIPLSEWCKGAVRETWGEWCGFGQFTGLRAKIEQMIFEGDILLDSYDEMQGTIIYDADDGMFRFNTVDGETYNFSDISSTDFEVIGNIHDTAKGE